MDLVLAVATILLAAGALVTAVVAITFAVRTARDSVRPLVVVQSSDDDFATGLFAPEIHNVGLGAAREIDGVGWFLEGGKEIFSDEFEFLEWVREQKDALVRDDRPDVTLIAASLGPNERRPQHWLPGTPRPSAEIMWHAFVYRLEYRDMFGRRITTPGEHEADQLDANLTRRS